ncbi:hypothetical protein TSUD_179040 [Trifolium subterraneum]|uniref:RNase H type-1 domain-containing protein n=1 Tax=Trifolium subterraneum TaxID=3900 RepID=A0A2Z6ME50_TRISU|nr:hypothetical protein TSUD_179040 [Trifolium subterraneum]
MKVNTNESVTSLPPSVACGESFRDHIASFHGFSAKKLAIVSILHTEIIAIILVIEITPNKGWNNVWIKSDSQAALCTFGNHEVVPWDLRNR